MAISIDYSTTPFTINIPQADLTFVSGTLYELDLNTFRLALKALEGSEDGIVFDDCHVHTTEATIAGVTFARVVEILSGCQVEFEAGTYSVRLAGANTNLFDVENGVLVQNTVQVIANNSAVLIVTEASGTLTAAAIADAVWNETASDHEAAGTTGKKLKDIDQITKIIPAAI